MTGKPPRPETAPFPETGPANAPPPTPERPTLAELVHQSEALGDRIAAHFKVLEGR